MNDNGIARVRGTVINIHGHGALIRLEDGALVAAPIEDVNANRSTYQRALTERKNLPFDALRAGRNRSVRMATTRIDEMSPTVLIPPGLVADPDFEEQVTDYLKQTQEWELAETAPAHERHFLRKKRRAAAFEARSRSVP